MATTSENWLQEAEGVINDVKSHVKNIQISKHLQCTNSSIYLNLTIIEGRRYCVQLSSQGFRIVGHEFDTNSLDSDVFYETPYSLLNEISEKFQESFANSLQNQLNKLLT